jgi:hypothetical protein
MRGLTVFMDGRGASDCLAPSFLCHDQILQLNHQCVRPNKLECCTVAQAFGDALELSRVPNHKQRVKMVKVAPLGLWC